MVLIISFCLYICISSGNSDRTESFPAPGHFLTNTKYLLIHTNTSLSDGSMAQQISIPYMPYCTPVKKKKSILYTK